MISSYREDDVKIRYSNNKNKSLEGRELEFLLSETLTGKFGPYKYQKNVEIFKFLRIGRYLSKIIKLPFRNQKK